MININNIGFEGPYENVSPLQHSQGVYAILDRRSDGRWHPIDVGESADVLDRVTNHDRGPCWNHRRQGVLGVAVAYTPGFSDNQRRLIERAVRDFLDPPCGTN